jgi:hypothetical protein
MKRAAIALAVVVLTGLAGRLIDFPKLAGGFKADEATYVLQAFSLIEDADLEYSPPDLLRFNRLYNSSGTGRIVGPEGIFLKRAAESDLYYAKGFAYALFAAPFAWLGGLGGMFLFNVLLLVLCAWCASIFAQDRVGSGWGWPIGVLFIAASSVPIWALYLMPEIFNFTLIFVAYFLWLYKEVRSETRVTPGDFLGSVWSDVAAAGLIAVAGYSKPSNIALMAPLLVHAAWKRDPKRAGILAAAFVVGLGVWFGANIAVTGEWNYQGGERKTFYGHFPFDSDGHNFDDASNSQGNATGGAKGLHPDILRPWQPHFFGLAATNAGYFLWGRDSGLIPYYFPGVLLCVTWLVRIRRTEAWQVWSFCAAAGTALILIVITPYTWNGGGGPVGSRYFLSAYPALFFLLPASTGAWTAIFSGIGGMAFLWPVFAHPFLSAREPWLHPATLPLRLLPVERTLADDIPARLHPERGRIEFGNPRNALLYIMDGNTYNGEPRGDGWGFWIAGDASTEIIVRTGFENAYVRIKVESAIANTFEASWGGSRCTIELQPNEPRTCELVASDGVWKRGAYLYSLKMSAKEGFVPAVQHPPSTDSRNLGVFVMPVFSEK